MRNISLYYLMGLSSCVSTKWGVTTIIMYCCCFVLFSVTHTSLCVSIKWGVTAIILYIVVVYCRLFNRDDSVQHWRTHCVIRCTCCYVVPTL